MVIEDPPRSLCHVEARRVPPVLPFEEFVPAQRTVIAHPDARQADAAGQAITGEAFSQRPRDRDWLTGTLARADSSRVGVLGRRGLCLLDVARSTSQQSPRACSHAAITAPHSLGMQQHAGSEEDV